MDDDKTYAREPLGPFHDLAKESFCKELAKGASKKTAGERAGIHYETSLRWSKADEIQARVRELRANAETFAGVSIGWVLRELQVNVEQARAKGQLKVSTESLMHIYQIVKTHPDLINDMPRAEPEGDAAKPAPLRLVESLRSLRQQLEMAREPDEEEEPA